LQFAGRDVITTGVGGNTRQGLGLRNVLTVTSEYETLFTKVSWWTRDRKIEDNYQFAFVVCLIILANFGNNNIGVVVGNAGGRLKEDEGKWRW
jgi:hypothetical protein